MLLRIAKRFREKYSSPTEGSFPRECPICAFKGEFLPTHVHPRPDALCPSCRSFERHRLLKLICDREELLRGRVLHFAPEPAVSRFVAERCDKYVTADLFTEADLILDIERMELPNASFDVVICSHVLEHVNDAKALSEIRRILALDGLAILAVPLVEAWPATYEDPAITGPDERRMHFGQSDHVRVYGRDFRDRVRAAGFGLEERMGTNPECVRYSLIRGEALFLARPLLAVRP